MKTTNSSKIKRLLSYGNQVRVDVQYVIQDHVYDYTIYDYDAYGFVTSDNYMLIKEFDENIREITITPIYPKVLYKRGDIVDVNPDYWNNDEDREEGYCEKFTINHKDEYGAWLEKGENSYPVRVPFNEISINTDNKESLTTEKAPSEAIDEGLTRLYGKIEPLLFCEPMSEQERINAEKIQEILEVVNQLKK